jgi:hypothetical protein
MIKTDEESAAFDGTIRTAPIIGSVPSEPVGLGQVIKGATRSVGLQPCGACERRAQRLDRWVSFGSVRADRRSVVVFAVVGVSAVGGSVAGGMLGRRVGSVVGTRLRDKLRDRGTRPERLDSVVGYAEKSGMVLGSVVGGTVAVLVVLSLANRVLINNPTTIRIGPATIPSIPKLDDLPPLPLPATGPIACKLNFEQCWRKAIREYIDRVFQCGRSSTMRCEQRAKRLYDEALEKCDRLYLCGSGEECCGSGGGAQCNCGTCGNVCKYRSKCINGSCNCALGTTRCLPDCCDPATEDCIGCSKDGEQWSICWPRNNTGKPYDNTGHPCSSGPLPP